MTNTLHDRFIALYGWEPSPEVAEFYATLQPEVDEYFYAEGWRFTVSGPRCFDADPASTFADLDAALLLFCGLERIGFDPFNSPMYMSTFTSAAGTALPYDITDGEVCGPIASSLAELESRFIERHEETALDELDPEQARRFREDAKVIAAAHPHPWQDPAALMVRCRWLCTLTRGEPGYYFARDLSRSPTFDVYTSEIELFEHAPWLLNYWLLAHFFLGNEAAGRDTITFARSSASAATRALGEAVEALMEGTTDTLAVIGAKELAALRAGALKNALPAQLEAPLDSSDPRGAAIAELATVADPFVLVERYPDDVGVHDAILRASATDEKLQRRVNRYFRERSCPAYNEWPGRSGDLDPRWSPFIATAFRSGLRYDADHDLAFAGVTRTLGICDDDHALAAYVEALEQLAVDDDRLEFVIEQLLESEHPGAPALVRHAAWKVFDRIDEAYAKSEAREAARRRDGHTLDNMFPTQNHLLPALRYALLEPDGVDSIQLAKHVLNYNSAWPSFGRRVGDALRVVARAGASEFGALATQYIRAVSDLEPNPIGLDVEVLCILGDASMAAAELDAEGARPLLRALFDRSSGSPAVDLDTKAGTLGGLLLLDGVTEEYRQWTHRLLANRSNPPRAIPTLAAVARTPFAEARDWVRYHVYSGKNEFLGWEGAIGTEARAAMAALGEAVAPADTTDRHGTRLAKSAEVAAAFEAPERYDPAALCERVISKELRGSELCDAIAKFTIDQLSYSSDNYSTGLGARDGALKALGVQGEPGAAAMARMFDIPGLSPELPSYLLILMRLATNEALLWMRAATMDIGAVVQQLREPKGPLWLPRSDLLAARVVVEDVDEARPLIEAALHRRSAHGACPHDHLALDRRHLPVALENLGREVPAEPVQDGFVFEERLPRGGLFSLSFDGTALEVSLGPLYLSMCSNPHHRSQTRLDPSIAPKIAQMARALGLE